METGAPFKVKKGLKISKTAFSGNTDKGKRWVDWARAPAYCRIRKGKKRIISWASPLSTLRAGVAVPDLRLRCHFLEDFWMFLGYFDESSGRS